MNNINNAQRLQAQAVVIEKIESNPLKAQEMIKGNYFQCEQILDFKIDKQRRSYLIKWRYYTDEWNTWEQITNIAPMAYQLAKFQQLNKDYIKSIEADWLERDMRSKRKKLYGVPHFTKQLQLLTAFASEYLNLDERELDQKLATFLQEIQTKQRRKRPIFKKRLNTTQAQSKPENSQHKSINKSFNETLGQVKSKNTKVTQNSFLEQSKSKEKSKRPKNLPICPIIKQSPMQLKYNKLIRHAPRQEPGKDEKFIEISRQISDQNISRLMSEISFGNINLKPSLSQKQKIKEKVQEIQPQKFSPTSFRKFSPTSNSFRKVEQQKEVKPNNKSPNEMTANDGTKLMIPDLFNALLTVKDIKQKKIDCKQIVRFYKIQEETIFELDVEINGLQQYVYINYMMMKTYFTKELLQYLQKNNKVLF